MKNIDPNSLPDFRLPDSLLDEIYNLTGESENNRGFLLFYVGQDGHPFVYKRVSNQTIELGLMKAYEQYSEGLNYDSEYETEDYS